MFWKFINYYVNIVIIFMSIVVFEVCFFLVVWEIEYYEFLI